MIAAGIERVEHHDCAICNFKCAYFRQGDQLYFDPRCYCSRGSIRVSPWQEAADWINMQSKPDIKERIAAKFGINAANSHQ
jgi:hypothetical protein